MPISDRNETMKNGSPLRDFEAWMMPGNDALYHGEIVRISGVSFQDGERLFGCIARNGTVILASDADLQPMVPSTAHSQQE